MSRYEDQLARQIELRGLPSPERQYRFALPMREYRADFAWPSRGLLVEVDGGAFLGRGGRGAVIGRATAVGYHQSPEDYRKRNLANLMGLTVLSFLPEQIARGEALAEIELWLSRMEGPAGQWAERLAAHVAQVREVDRLRRATRESKARQRKWLRSMVPGERR